MSILGLILLSIVYNLSLLYKLHLCVLTVCIEAAMRKRALHPWEERVTILIIVNGNVAPCINCVRTNRYLRLLPPVVLRATGNWRYLPLSRIVLWLAIAPTHGQKFNLLICPLELPLQFFNQKLLLLDLP